MSSPRMGVLALASAIAAAAESEVGTVQPLRRASYAAGGPEALGAGVLQMSFLVMKGVCRL